MKVLLPAGALLGQACCYGALLFLGDLRRHVPATMFIFGLCFLLYLLTLRRLLHHHDSDADRPRHGRRGSYLASILGCALCFRLILWPAAPSLSDDIYRYVWEGRVVASGHNPFALAPDAPELEHLRDGTIHPLVSRPRLTAIYPPLAQLMFAAAVAVDDSVAAMKGAFLLFDCATVGLLLLTLRSLGKSPLQAAVYALNPLVIVEFSGSGHLDSAGIFFMVLALYCFTQRRRLWAAGALALAFLVKLLPALLLPVVGRSRKLSSAAVFAAVAAAGALPFLDAGRGLYATLTVYADNWLFNGSLYNLIFLLIPDNQDARRVAAVLFCLCAAAWWYRLRDANERSGPDAVFRQCQFLLGLALAFTPVLHPWYMCWMVPILAIAPCRAWLLFSGLVFSAYWVLRDFEAAGLWRESPAVLLFEYLPLYGLLLFDCASNAARKRQAALT